MLGDINPRALAHRVPSGTGIATDCAYRKFLAQKTLEQRLQRQLVESHLEGVKQRHYAAGAAGSRSASGQRAALPWPTVTWRRWGRVPLRPTALSKRTPIFLPGELTLAVV